MKRLPALVVILSLAGCSVLPTAITKQPDKAGESDAVTTAAAKPLSSKDQKADESKVKDGNPCDNNNGDGDDSKHGCNPTLPPSSVVPVEPTVNVTPTPSSPTTSPNSEALPEARIFVHKFVRANINDAYIVEKTNVKLYTESWGRASDDLTYFGPTNTNAYAHLIFKYTVDRPVKSGRLYLETFSFDHTSTKDGTGWGKTMVTVSRDGYLYHIVQNNPTPFSGPISEKKGFVELPKEVIGGKSIYVRVLLYSTYSNSYSNSQFCRTESGRTEDCYQAELSF